MSVCARCPKLLGRSCCEVREGESLATLTGVDVERIAEATGLSPKRFVEVEWLTEEDAARYEAMRPLYAGYFRHLPKRLSLRTRGGACVFLGASGCTLAPEVRPRACRLYPFEPSLDGELTILPDRHGELSAAAGAAHACLALEEADSLEALLAAFEATPEALRDEAAALAREVAEHARQMAPGGRFRALAPP